MSIWYNSTKYWYLKTLLLEYYDTYMIIKWWELLAMFGALMPNEFLGKKRRKIIITLSKIIIFLLYLRRMAICWVLTQKYSTTTRWKTNLLNMFTSYFQEFWQMFLKHEFKEMWQIWPKYGVWVITYLIFYSVNKAQIIQF